MKAHLGVAALLAAAFVVSTKPAQAAGDAKGLGEKGQLIITADRLVPLFSYTRGSTTQTQGGVELTDSHTGSGISLLFGRNVGYTEGAFPVNVHTIPRVAVDFTIIPKLTLGASIAFGFGLGGSNNDEVLQGGVKVKRTTDSPTATAIGFAPRIGYILPLGNVVAFWPRAGFAFYSVSARTDVVDPNNPANVTTTSITDKLLSLDLDPQFAFVPLEHFFFHLGPLVNIPLSGSRSRQTTTGANTVTVSNDISLFHFGVTAGLGGWFDL